MSNEEFDQVPLFPADWGKRRRKVCIELSEFPNKDTHCECFIEENGIRISATEVTDSVIPDFMPLITTAEKMLENFPGSKTPEDAKK